MINLHPKLTENRIIRAMEKDNYLGFCVKCGEQFGRVGLNARKWKCILCGKNSVYGALELLFMMGYKE